MRVLLVEDDRVAAHGVALALRSNGAVVDSVDTGEEALGLVRHYDYDIVMLDLMLPDMMGVDVVRKMRTGRISVPIIILSEDGEIRSKVQLLSSGADDYMNKPVSFVELIERMRAVVRRSRGISESSIIIGGLAINFSSKRVTVNGLAVHLTGKEYAILELLMLRKGSVLTKETFLGHLYGGMDEPEIKIIDVFICKLRRKLSLAGSAGIIETVWGQGYTMRECHSDLVS